MKDKAHDNVVFRKLWWQSIKNLPSEARLETYDAICKYAFEGIEPACDPMSAVSMALSFIKQDIDAAKEKYEDICTKRAEAGRRHTGNQYTRVKQTEQMFQNGTNGTDNDNDNDMIMKGKDKENEKDKSFSFSKEKEKIIFDFSLVLLSEGRPNAYIEAREAYEFNDATGWITETTKPNGDVTKKIVKNKLAWLRGWKRTNEQMFAPADGTLYAQIFTGFETVKEENQCVINAFRGIQQCENGIVVLFSNRTAIERFSSAFETNNDFKRRVCKTFKGQYPEAECINYKLV